jgi:hypothetical protein
MAVTFDKVAGEANDGATSATLAVTVATGGVAAGNLVVLGISHNAGSTATAISSITDTRSNTWTQIGSSYVGVTQNDIRTWLYYAVLTTALQAGDTITITFNASVFAGKTCCAVAYSGVSATPLDQQNHAEDDSFPKSQPVGPSLTTTEADEVLVSFTATQNLITWTATTNWTRRDTLTQSGDYAWEFEDRIVSATGTYNSAPTSSADEYWQNQTASFKGSGSSPNFQPIGSRWARPPSWHAIPGSLRFRNWSNNPGTVFAIDVAAADATLPPKDIVTLQAVNRSSTW